MIKAYNGFKAHKSTGNIESLPAGGYVAKIKMAKEQELWGKNVITIAFDIAEGDHTGWFQKEFQNNKNENKWWSGTYSVNIPTGEEEEWKRRGFENLIACLEESNPGYHWDWNEAALKGLLIGVLFGNVEKAAKNTGNPYWTTRCGGTASVDDIREGSFKIPADRPLKNKKQAATNINANDFVPAGDVDDVPF